VTEEAVRRGVFGALAFFVGDEMFWGNDRLHFVEAASEEVQERQTAVLALWALRPLECPVSSWSGEEANYVQSLVREVWRFAKRAMLAITASRGR
jgi:hypothetical protein